VRENEDREEIDPVRERRNGERTREEAGAIQSIHASRNRKKEK
jgi:hypothetical protein